MLRKRILCLLMAVLSLVAFTSCSKSAPVETAPDSSYSSDDSSAGVSISDMIGGSDTSSSSAEPEDITALIEKEVNSLPDITPIFEDVLMLCSADYDDIAWFMAAAIVYHREYGEEDFCNIMNELAGDNYDLMKEVAKGYSDALALYQEKSYAQDNVTMAQNNFDIAKWRVDHYNWQDGLEIFTLDDLYSEITSCINVYAQLFYGTDLI